MTQSELKPCPFCQSDRIRWCDTTPAGQHWFACDECSCEGPTRDTKAEAIAAWNTRTPPNPSEPLVERDFQARVDKWMDACFNDEIKADVQERCDRFIEEALEFIQAAGYSAERAHALVDYTFNRPQGEINQEVGGVMVTLAAMCNTLKVDIGACAETELARVWTKIDTIRAKQAAKPTGSALPVALAALPAPADDVVEALRKCRDKFREYEGIHTLKLRDYKGKEPLNYAAEIQFKINRNREMADMCDAALAKGRP